MCHQYAILVSVGLLWDGCALLFAIPLCPMVVLESAQSDDVSGVIKTKMRPKFTAQVYRGRGGRFLPLTSLRKHLAKA